MSSRPILSFAEQLRKLKAAQQSDDGGGASADSGAVARDTGAEPHFC